jgi:hypothetical protein
LRRRREEAVKSPEVFIALGNVDFPVVTSVDDERFENLIQKGTSSHSSDTHQNIRTSTNLVKYFHRSLLLFLALDSPSNMFHANPNKILPHLPTDEEVTFFDRDEDDDNVEGGKFKPRAGVDGCDSFRDGVLVLRGVSRGVGEDSPERHLV